MTEKIFHIGEEFNEISGHARDEFLNALVDLKESESEVLVLDFTDVTALSSLGLAAIGKLHTQLKEEGRHLRIEGLSEHLYRIFDITGLIDMLDVKEPEIKTEDE